MKFYSIIAINLALFVNNAAAQNGCQRVEFIPDNCVDLTPGGQTWFDASGPAYEGGPAPGCAWYGAYWDRCQRDGNQHEHFGMTACEACCSCGGGVIVDPPTPPTPKPTRPPTPFPTPPPVERIFYIDLYEYHSGKDSVGGNLITIPGLPSLTETSAQTNERLAELCALIGDECLGFNSKGELKERIEPKNDWVEMVPECDFYRCGGGCGLFTKLHPQHHFDYDHHND